MRQKLYLFLLTVLLGMTGMNAWAQLSTTTIDGKEYYKIAFAEDLAEFAAMVNTGGDNLSANAILTQDIDMADMVEMNGWTAIGDWGGVSGTTNAGYTGHFDGQGHTITGFNATSSHNYYGIFGVIEGNAVVENFSIDGTLSLGHKTGGVVGYARNATIRGIHSNLDINVTEAAATALRPGGILGSAVNGTTNVVNCSYSGTLNVGGHTGNIGGIVGYVNNNAAAIVNITNCLFDGEILNGTTADGQCGGIVGYNNAGTLTVKNCLSIGTIEAKSDDIGQFIGRLNGSNTTFANNYYTGDYVNGTASGKTAKGDAPVKVTAEQLASGEICFLLNESVSGGEGWFQTLNDDAYPFPFSGSIHDIIYLAGRTHCDGSAYEGVTGYTNEPATQDDHDYQDGICTYCGTFDPDAFEPVDGYYQIATANQLKWFAAYVNQVDAAANAVMTADIALTDAWTMPIGSSSKPYTGIFDGQGHKITGFSGTSTGYFGIIGYANGATVKDFSVAGTMTVNSGTGSGIVGYTLNSTISGIHSTLAITVPKDDVHHVAGVVGSSQSGNTISRCSFAGSVEVTGSTRDCFGGVCGYIKADKVENCVSYGPISYTKADGYIGGVVGYLNNVSGFIKNCLATGTVTYAGEGDPTYGGTLIGRLATHTAANITGNYWLENTSHAGIGQNVPNNNNAATADQLANGYVAGKMAPFFRQNIGTDIYPVLDPTHNVVAEITDAGYATLYVPDADVTVPAGVTAYTAQIAVNENTGKQHLALAEVEGGVIPAQTAVILKGAEGIYEFAVSTEETIPDGAFKIHEDVVDGSNALVKGWAAPIEGNVLKGTAEEIDAEGKYVLAKVDGKVCFYLATSGTIKAGKAYLEITSDVKAFYFSFDDATGIEMVNGQWSTANGQSIFNLAGQRLQKMQRGINITAGKKILK